MALQQTEALKPVAIALVLNRLDRSVRDIIKYYLECDYDIIVDSVGRTSCSFEQLSLALEKLAGRTAAVLILEEIFVELDRLLESENNRGNALT